MFIKRSLRIEKSKRDLDRILRLLSKYFICPKTELSHLFQSFENFVQEQIDKIRKIYRLLSRTQISFKKKRLAGGAIECQSIRHTDNEALLHTETTLFARKQN